MGTNKTKAFTLVELIVVITILAILGTIAFVSLSGYSRDSRNSVRVSDVSLINTSLELFSIPVGKYPSPSNATNISSGATIVGYMGTVGESVTTQLKKLSKLPLDPKSNQAYEYSITASKREFQVMYQLEDGLASITSQANAASTIPELKGNYNELYTISENGSEYFAMPSLFPVNPDLTQAEGFVMNNESTAVAFTAKSLGAKPTTSTGYINFTKALQNAYTGSLFNSKPAYTTLKAINLTDTGALETFTKASFGLLKADATVITSTTPTTPTVVVPTDPYWSNVGLALDFEGGAIDLTEKHTPSVVGTAVIDSNSKFGSSGYTQDGGVGYLTVPASPDFQFEDGDFTVEFFFKPGAGWPGSTSGANPALIGTWNAGNGDPWLLQYVPGSSTLRLLYSIDGIGLVITPGSSAPFTPGTWYHVAYQRKGNQIQSFIDGVLGENTTVAPFTMFVENVDLRLGSQGGFNYNNGSYDEVRITKGVARYGVEGFDVPTVTMPTQ